MEQQPSADDDEIEQQIYSDLITLARHAGLKDARFGLTQLIQTGLLPGDHTQQSLIYSKLIANNIESVEPREVREALCVKLNLRDGYPDSGSQERLRLLGGNWGRVVRRYGDGKRRNKRTEDQAREGQRYLARLIREEIDCRNENATWNELLQGASRRSVRNSPRVDDEAAQSRGSVGPMQSLPNSHAQTLMSSDTRQVDPSRARSDIGIFPPRTEVIAIPMAPDVLDILEMARGSCETANRKFVTPHLLLALLDMPDSKVAQCFDQARPGLAREWQELLRAYQDRARNDETFDRYRRFDWDHRWDVRRAKEIVWQDAKAEVTELYLFLGVLDNQRSKTRRELVEYLGVEDFDNLCQVADRMREADDTPRSTLGYSDDVQ